MQLACYCGVLNSYRKLEPPSAARPGPRGDLLLPSFTISKADKQKYISVTTGNSTHSFRVNHALLVLIGAALLQLESNRSLVRVVGFASARQATCSLRQNLMEGPRWPKLEYTRLIIFEMP